jgi:hypothetical protein
MAVMGDTEEKATYHVPPSCETRPRFALRTAKFDGKHGLHSRQDSQRGSEALLNHMDLCNIPITKQSSEPVIDNVHLR